MDDLYRDYILEHYRRPHNFGVIEDPSASYEGANPLCGDRITLHRFRCASKTKGVRCVNHKSGHGFFVSRETVRLF